MADLDEPASPDPMQTGRHPARLDAADRERIPAIGAGLSSVPSTLRIPLAARAFGDALFPEVAVGDAHARALHAALGDAETRWLRDRSSVYGVLARTRRFRELAARFLREHPDGHVVNLGCGLSDYFQWLDNGRARMTDADLPEVLALRRALLPARGERHALREVDLAAADWWEQLGLPAGRDGQPVFLLSEGVFMYLEPPTVAAVLGTFGNRAPPGSSLAFDAMCWLAIGRAKRHPSVKRTTAEFNWGPRRLADVTAPSPRLRLAAAYPVMEGYGLPYSLLGPCFRFLFDVPFYALYHLRAQDP